MSHVFHRYPRTQLPVAVAGQGIHITDSTGKRYLDASGGAAVSCLGHGHPASLPRSAARPRRWNMPIPPSSPRRRRRAWPITWRPARRKASLMPISSPAAPKPWRPPSNWRGNTLGALAIGGNAWRRKPFLPILVPAHHVSPCYAYRGLEPGEDEASYSRRLAQELEAKILEIGPDKVAAFVAETVVGATLGAVPPTAGYFREIRAVCDKYGVLLILDEVMSGMGRTGHLFACTEDEVVPDIVVIATGLGAGYQPIGAMMAHRRIYEAILGGSGFFQHRHTYLGHAIACAAALEVQKTIAEEHLLPKVRRLGERLQDRLQERLGQHPHVGDIRGRGLCRGIEFVADRENKEPLDPALRTHAKLKTEAMRRGLLTYPMGGTVDGVRGDHVLLAPPFICTEAEIDEIVGRLAESIDVILPAH